MRAVATGWLLAFLSAGAAAGQQPYVPSLDDLAYASSLVRHWVDDGRVPGAVLSVWQGGRPVFEASYGAAQAYGYGEGQYDVWRVAGARGPRPLPEPVPMTVGTAFDLASVTKVMATTLAVALLVDEGRVALDASVSTYLPDLTGGGKERVTIEHLLTHRSGLSQWQPIYYHASDPAAVHRYIRDLPLEWPVGRERHYSDLGFMVLGLVVERVAGTDLDSFLRREVYGPLGLDVTGFRGGASPERRDTDVPFAATSHGNPFEHRMVHDPDFGYRIGGDPDAWADWRRYTLVGEVNDGNAHHAFGGVAGHAGLFSTAGELQLLLRIWLGRGEAGGTRYLRRETVERFLESRGDGQALGWQLPEFAPSTSFGHNGFTGTFVMGVPTSGLGVVLLTNRQNGGVDADTAYPELGELQRGVVRALNGGR